MHLCIGNWIIVIAQIWLTHLSYGIVAITDETINKLIFSQYTIVYYIHYAF